jgi:hypothetical protein
MNDKMVQAAPAPPGELFTRGSADAVDARGQSMVAKHLEKLQKEKEQVAMERLRVLAPRLAPAVRAVALQECDWEADRALEALQAFQAAKAPELAALQAERQQHGASAGQEQGGGDGDGSGSSSGDGSSSSDDGGRRRRSSKRSKRTSKDGKKRSSSRREEGKKKRKREKDRAKDTDKDRKRRHRDKTGKDAAAPAAAARRGAVVGEQYGRHGLIRETDAYAKRPEFALWATEVKRIDIESLPRFEEKELFRSFMEDYNTATMPHQKYYDLATHERAAAAARAAGGPGGGEERLAFDDEGERRAELAAARQREQAERLRAAYVELQTTGKAEEMRGQEMLRAKMALAYRTGDQKEAARLAERLKPDDQKAPAEAARAPRDPAAGT